MYYFADVDVGLRDESSVFKYSFYSVSPKTKKGHGKIAKKGHFLTRGSMSKRALSARHGKRKGTFKWLMAC